MKRLVKMVLIIFVLSLCGMGVQAKTINKEKNICLYVMSSGTKKFNEWRKTVIKDISKYYKVVVISNGELNDKCDGVDKIIVRPNEGHDFGAWKQYIVENYYYIKQFDNLLIANDSFYRVSPMDDAIKKGINGKFDLYGMKYTKNKKFLESYFINFKKRVINSRHFINFWKDMPQIKSHRDACNYGESKITRHLENHGFKSQDFRNTDGNTSIYRCAKVLTDRDDFPIVKRKAVK